MSEVTITHVDDVLTNALAGRTSVYFRAMYPEMMMHRTPPSRASLSGACDAEIGSRGDRPNLAMRQEVLRLYLEGVVIPVQRRRQSDGVVVVDYLATPARLRTKRQFVGCYRELER